MSYTLGGYAFEGTPGVLTAPTEFIPITKVDFQAAYEQVLDNFLRSHPTKDVEAYRGVLVAEGGVGTLGYPEVVSDLLYAIAGARLNHTSSPATTVPTLTFQVQDYGVDLYRRYTGCRVVGLDLSAEGEALKVVADLVAQEASTGHVVLNYATWGDSPSDFTALWDGASAWDVAGGGEEPSPDWTERSVALPFLHWTRSVTVGGTAWDTEALALHLGRTPHLSYTSAAAGATRISVGPLEVTGSIERLLEAGDPAPAFVTTLTLGWTSPSAQTLTITLPETTLTLSEITREPDQLIATYEYRALQHDGMQFTVSGL
jgi:hypothetical protein